MGRRRRIYPDLDHWGIRLDSEEEYEFGDHRACGPDGGPPYVQSLVARNVDPIRPLILFDYVTIRYTLALAVEDGRLVTDYVVVKRTPDDAALPAGTLLGQVKVGELLRIAIDKVLSRAEKGELVWIRDLPAHVPRRGNQLENEHYRQVAAIYRDALTAGLPPTKTVAEAMHTARSNAGRWVMEARKRGFLGEAVPNKAGERVARPAKRRK